MMYAEELPPRCPPASATERAFPKIYRLVKASTVFPACFHSKAKLGEPNKGKADACSYASCSLVIDPVEQLRRWPRMRETFAFAAELQLPAGLGKASFKANSNHAHFWPYQGANLTATVVGVMELPEVATNG